MIGELVLNHFGSVYFAAKMAVAKVAGHVGRVL